MLERVRKIFKIKTQAEKLAESRGLKVSKTYTESKSAKEPGRQQFTDMLAHINDRDDIKGIVTWQLNRLSRNPIDTAKLQWLLQKGSIDEIVTPHKIFTEYESDLIMSIEGGMANKFIRDLRINTKRGIDAKLDKGLAPIMAPVGYVNDKHLRQGEKTISPHPIYFGLMRKMFSLSLTGTYTIQELRQKTIDMGIKNNLDRFISETRMADLLRNPFYCGKFLYNKRVYQGIHKPLITESEFNLLQDILEGKSRPKKQKHDFPLGSCLVTCKCGFKISAERKVKPSGLVFDYYRCSQQHKGCNQPTASGKDLEEQVERFLKSIQLSKRNVAWARKWVGKLEKEDNGVRENKYKALKKDYEETDSQLNNLTQKWLSSTNSDKSLLTDDEYRDLKQQLFLRKQDLSSKIKNRDKNWEEWSNLTIEILSFASEASTSWKLSTAEEKRRMLSTACSNLVLDNKILTFVPRDPFKLIQKALQARPNSSVEANTSTKHLSKPALGG